MITLDKCKIHKKVFYVLPYAEKPIKIVIIDRVIELEQGTYIYGYDYDACRWSGKYTDPRLFGSYKEALLYLKDYYIKKFAELKEELKNHVD